MTGFPMGNKLKSRRRARNAAVNIGDHESVIAGFIRREVRESQGAVGEASRLIPTLSDRLVGR